MLSILIFGFLLGLRHAMEADHVAAVASMATRSTSLAEGIRVGATWGIGHTLTLLLFGSIVIFSHSLIPETMALGLEFTVGIMLVTLGIDVIYRMRKERIHFHMHEHADGIKHFHAHSHANEGAHSDSAHEHEHKKFSFRPLFVGMMHGMAGSAALIALTLQTVETPALGFVYILIFGLGSVLGMAIMATIIMIPLRQSAKRLTHIYGRLQTTIGIATLGLGLYVMYEIGIVQGLVV
ncbi:sulfite exporter TauE/SafE family protein [Ghiorsea bivora]|uniref:urease accessory protein n=1 Tax=Ghiorsea bivora TaxID=1485545 RepID=UPI00056F2DBB|nr:urease accessory protein [Ghiorsea bivora]